MDNAKALSGSDMLDLTYKFMIVPENQYEILEACGLARRVGFKNFFVRPASWENVRGLENLDLSFDVEGIKKQLERCWELEDENFKVYHSFGRVGEKLKRVIRFTRCLVTPIMAVFCADGWCYPCIDMRGHREYRMCRHLELRDYWNSEEHLKLIESIDLDNCPRCAMGHYNEQIEAYLQDYFFWKFP